MHSETTVWDPFVGTRKARRDSVPRPKRTLRLPPWTTLPLLLLGFGGLVWGLAVGDGESIHQLVGFGLFSVVIAIIVLADTSARVEQTNHWLFSRVAQTNDWSFMPVSDRFTLHRYKALREGRVPKGAFHWTFLAFSQGSAAKDDEAPVDDLDNPVLHPAYKHLKPLLRPGPGNPFGVLIEALFWGKTTTGIPFWAGAGMMDINIQLAAAALRSDAYGNTGSFGKIVTLVVAYRLGRDTGINATLTAEPLGMDGWRDLKTESIAFNRAFNITLEQDRTAKADNSELDLLRLLTPAVQDRLLDLSQRYHVQLMVRGAVLYLSGHERVATDDPDRIATLLHQIIADFADAAVSFKQYAE